MPFQALPIAFKKNTGSPLSKLLLIYLMNKCEVPPAEFAGGVDPESDAVEFYAEEAACFCQCSEADIYVALAELERLRLVFPDSRWTFQREFTKPEDRWSFLVVAMPLSLLPPANRRRIKASPDQIELLVGLGDRRCPCCRRKEDEFDCRWVVDHIVPQSRLGADVEENCQAVCSDCNSRKHARMGWVDFLGGRRG